MGDLDNAWKILAWVQASIAERGGTGRRLWRVLIDMTARGGRKGAWRSRTNVRAGVRSAAPCLVMSVISHDLEAGDYGFPFSPSSASMLKHWDRLTKSEKEYITGVLFGAFLLCSALLGWELHYVF